MSEQGLSEMIDELLKVAKRHAYYGDLNPDYAAGVLRRIGEYDESEMCREVHDSLPPLKEVDERYAISETVVSVISRLSELNLADNTFEDYEGALEDYFELLEPDHRTIDNLGKGVINRFIQERLGDERVRLSRPYMIESEYEMLMDLEWRDPKTDRVLSSEFNLYAQRISDCAESRKEFDKFVDNVVSKAKDDPVLSDVISDFRYKEYVKNCEGKTVSINEIIERTKVRDLEDFYEDGGEELFDEGAEYMIYSE